MKFFKFKFLVISIFSWNLIVSQTYPSIKTNGLSPGDAAFTQVFESSKVGELTIMSFNVRDVRGTSRSLEDFRQLANLIKNADIVVFQELGAKGYSKKEEKNNKMMERFNAMVAVYKSYLGAGWKHEIAATPTPHYLGLGAELPLVLYREFSNGMTIDIDWNGYHDLGDKRDMGLFNVTCTKGISSEVFTIGSVHTKPACPERGQQLTRIGKYAEDHTDSNFILLGDFNFGYKSNCDNGYEGENYIRNLHQNKKAFLVFNDISYNGNGDNDNFRTNLDRRSKPHMYDQFLISNSYANKLADGGSLTEDCGWISFSKGDYFTKVMSKEARSQMKGFKKAMEYYKRSTTSTRSKNFIKNKEKEIQLHYTTVNTATHHLSDHKPIWLQLKLV